jgi:hypothetical protein
MTAYDANLRHLLMTRVNGLNMPVTVREKVWVFSHIGNFSDTWICIVSMRY